MSPRNPVIKLHGILAAVGAAVALVSGAPLGVGLTGICMWFTRRPNKTAIVLRLMNALFVGVALSLMRTAAP